MGESLIAGQYLLIEQVGRGSFAVVWRARDERLRRDVAVKQLFLPPHFTEEQRREHRERTLREARSAARLSHPGVVTVHDVVEHDGFPWIVMEFVHGRTLGQIVRTDGPLSPRRAAEIGLALLDALRAAHESGVLHRDVKPSNVIVGARRVVLGDFGIARVEDEEDDDLTCSGIVMGAPSYTAPERARGEPAIAASDLWSLGATIFYAVEGRRAFGGPNPNATFHAILTRETPPARRAGALTPVIEGLLRKDPAVRMGAKEAAALLADAACARSCPPTPRVRRAAGRAGSSRRRSTRRRSTHRRPVLAAASLTASLTALALVLVGNAMSVDDPRGRPAASYRKPSPGPRLAATLPTGRGEILSMAFSPDGRTLVTGGQDQAVHLWNVAGHRPAGTLTGPRRPISTTAFSPDGHTLAAASDSTVILWSGPGYRRTTMLDTHGHAIGALSFSPDGRTLTTAGDTVRRWDVADRRSAAPEAHVTTPKKGAAPARAVRPGAATGRAPTTLTGGMAFSPDGRTLVTGGDDRTIRLWNVAGHRLTGTIPWLTGQVSAVAVSPDDHTLACSAGGTVLLWNLQSHSPTNRLDTRTHAVEALAFNPDGHTLATAGGDATVRLWSLG